MVKSRLKYLEIMRHENCITNRIYLFKEKSYNFETKSKQGLFEIDELFRKDYCGEKYFL